jgi:hypothetical protein
MAFSPGAWTGGGGGVGGVHDLKMEKKQKWHWRKEVKCQRSRGGPI